LLTALVPCFSDSGSAARQGRALAAALAIPDRSGGASGWIAVQERGEAFSEVEALLPVLEALGGPEAVQDAFSPVP